VRPGVGDTGAGVGGPSGAGAAGARVSAGALGTDGSGAVANRPPTSLREAADRARGAFDVAIAVRDADAAAACVLDLEQAIVDWTADTLQSDDGDHARRTLRGMVLELAAAARDGLADPAARIAPLVDALLERRAAARSARDFATADALRDRLAAAGVEVRDSPTGPQWSVRPC
jgi:cysteinyl-tRNA synthetase